MTDFAATPVSAFGTKPLSPGYHRCLELPWPPYLQRPAWYWRRRNPVMKAWSVISLLFAAAIFATIPISPQVTPRGVELSVNQAQAILGHWRRVNRRGYRRACRRG